MKPINLGGQAVMEGVMIQSPKHVSMAARRKDGSITVVVEDAPKFSTRHAWAKWPIVRGVVNLVVQMKSGYRMLMKSADYIAIDETGKPEASLGWAGALAMTAGVVLALGLFVVLPNVLMTTLMPTNTVWKNLIEGLVRILILAAYMGSVGLMKDMKRVYMYHGAEHRVLHCYEHDLQPTPENARQFSVVHPRCGTSFLFLVALIGILVFTILGRSGWASSSGCYPFRLWRVLPTNCCVLPQSTKMS
jgi:uncharacterized protein YqhQ